jgi:hypothetical protein
MKHIEMRTDHGVHFAVYFVLDLLLTMISAGPEADAEIHSIGSDRRN